MKKFILFLTLAVVLGCKPANNETTTTPEDVKFIEWTGNNEAANEMVVKGLFHFLNAEQEKAYVFFEAATQIDTTLFAPHVCLAEMAIEGSAKQQFHIEKAKQHVADKNETSKMFVSLLDLNPDGYWGYFDASTAHDLWAKMHEMEPRGKFIHYFYGFTTKEVSKSIEILEDLKQELIASEDSFGYGHVLNVLGYKYMAQANNEKAAATFKEYIETNADDYNPYDSMGEFMLFQKDTLQAKAYYTKALDKFPFSNNAKTVLSVLN